MFPRHFGVPFWRVILFVEVFGLVFVRMRLLRIWKGLVGGKEGCGVGF